MVNGVPAGWKIMRHSGTPVIRLEKFGDAYMCAWQVISRSGFGLEKEVSVDLKEYPYLNWTWTATRLPRAATSESATDDRRPDLRCPAVDRLPETLNYPILTYVWDNEAPKGLITKSPKPLMKKIRYVVVRNKTDRLGTWYTEKRNVYEDFRKVFRDVDGGEPRGATHGLRFYINSQNTKSQAEGYIGEVYFSKS